MCHRPLLALALLAAMACEEQDRDQNDTGAPAEASGCGEPTPLHSLDELMTALRAGRAVQVGLYYGQCTLDGAPVIDAQGGMDVTAWEWFAAGSIGNDQDYVAFSKSSLIQLYGEHYYDYVKVRLYADGAVEITAQYLDPVDLSVEMNEVFDCTLDTGEGGAVTLFAR
ncbi:MAG: VirK family protein [Pseudomonadota bacterium]